jgi:peptidase E
MTEQQPIYLFAGGRGKTIFSSFKEIGRVLKQTGKKKPTVALVGVASFGDNPLFMTLMSLLLKSSAHCEVRRVSIAKPSADLDKAKEILRTADAVFMGGGDAEAGMKILQEKNMEGFLHDLLKQGKLFLGASAGTILMCREWVCWQDPEDDATAACFPCLGMAPVICDTHAEGDDWVELKTALQLKEEGAIGYGIISGNFLTYYPDGRLVAGNGPAARFVKKDGKVEKLPDLLPSQ